MHYTIHQSSKIDQEIGRQLKYIVQELRLLLGDKIHSILLCGGFGRGEGSVEIKAGRIHIVNDYDISLVFKEKNWLKYMLLYKKFHPELTKLAQRLAKKLKMKQIDIGLKHLSYFDNQPLKIENYEALKGHILLHGEKDPYGHMLDYKAKDIPLFEGTRLFRNRGGGLLIAARYFLDNNRTVPDKNQENFVIECNKAILAMGDSILLLKRRYHYLYQRRKEIIETLDLSDIPAASAIVPHYLEALRQKLEPDFGKFSSQDMIEWWFEIVGLFDKFYRYFESQRLEVNFNSWLEYVQLKKPEDKIDKRRLLKALVCGEVNILSFQSVQRNILQVRKFGLIYLMVFLLFSIDKDGFYQPYLEKSAKMLGMKRYENLLRNWRQLTSMFFRLWHPAGEAGRFIGGLGEEG